MSKARALALPLLASASIAPAFAAEAGEGGGSVLVTPQIGTMFWTVVTFVLLMVLLRLVAWKPLLGALEAREKGIRGDLEEARREREEASKLLEEHRGLVDQARRERAEAVEAGRKEAERLKDEILAEGRRQREQLLAQGEAQIEAQVRQARLDLRASAADLAIEVAGKLLSKELDDAAHRKLVEEHLGSLDGLPPGSASRPS